MSIPDWTSWVNTLEEFDVGPIVQTILVAMVFAFVVNRSRPCCAIDPIVHNTFSQLLGTDFRITNLWYEGVD